AATVFMLDMFRTSSKLLMILNGHEDCVNDIDFSNFNGQFICSGSDDKTVRLWDIESGKQIRVFNGHLTYVYCAKFSLYHRNYHNRNVICSSSNDKTIRFWDIKDNRQLKIFYENTHRIRTIELSTFSGGRYLCSGSYDKTIRLWDIDTSNLLCIFNRHEGCVRCVAISPLHSAKHNKNDSESNSIGVIGGNGYTICSGSDDNTIRIWDIEKTKQSIEFKGHDNTVISVKYGPNGSGNSGTSNTILSGSWDNSVRLWDIRSSRQIQVFNGHNTHLNVVEYSPFVVDNIEANEISNVICSGSWDNTLRFWDIRSSKKELHVMKENNDQNNGILCVKFIKFKNKRNYNENESNNCGVHLYISFDLNKKDAQKFEQQITNQLYKLFFFSKHLGEKQISFFLNEGTQENIFITFVKIYWIVLFVTIQKQEERLESKTTKKKSIAPKKKYTTYTHIQTFLKKKLTFKGFKGMQMHTGRFGACKSIKILRAMFWRKTCQQI
ncbi:WD repeat-containing protein, partial [Reticulomyxa filosa]